mgnify:CR=1 FL=1
MTKQRAIASRDHGAGVPEQGFDGVARGGCLPVIAIKRADPKYGPRNLLLGRPGAVAVEGLQHPSQPRPLLRSQATVERDSATVECGEQAADGF